MKIIENESFYGTDRNHWKSDRWWNRCLVDNGTLLMLVVAAELYGEYSKDADTCTVCFSNKYADKHYDMKKLRDMRKSGVITMSRVKGVTKVTINHYSNYAKGDEEHEKIRDVQNS